MRLALVGDIHGHWTDEDNAWFRDSGYAGVLFTGDLPGRSHRDMIRVARSISGVGRPAILVPGNHDGPSPIDVLREALFTGMGRSAVPAMTRKVDALRDALGPVQLGGYSVHTIEADGRALDIVVARPHGMDSRRLCFQPYLQATFGVADLQASTEQLRACLAACTHPIVVLAHNGPFGLGHHRSAPWGLSLFGRDNGDRDLTDALAWAAEAQKPVVAVVAGHMHWSARRPRTWQTRRDGVLYVNAARVPRIHASHHHHIALEIDSGPVASATSITVGPAPLAQVSS